MDGRNLPRWASVTAAAFLAAAGLKRGGRTGALMSLAGGALGVTAYMRLGKRRNAFDVPDDAHEWEMPNDRLMEDAKAFSRSARRVDEHTREGADEVGEASDESFPASDAPSFTPTTSLGGHERDDQD